MKIRIFLIATLIACCLSCKNMDDVEGFYEVVMVGQNDYSSHDITMNIEMGAENSISGKSACNSYSGTFKNPQKNTVTMGMFMGTKMYCQDTNAIERDYMDYLSQVTTVNSTDEGLELMNESGDVIITALRTEGKK
jgi:heat shock protein HslJ